MRTILILLLALALPLAALAEAADPPPEDILAEDEVLPAELDEFELALPGDLPAGTPEPAATAEPTPVATLKPGSINYPDGKVSFEDEIWRIMTGSWGLEPHQAAGLLGNICAESACCPYNAENRDGIDNRSNYRFRTGDAVGFGLCQWTSRGRKSALYDYAVACGDPGLVWDFDIQMGFMASEIDLASIRAMPDLYTATEWAVLVYERPDQRYANSWPGTRYEIAKRVYRAHTGGDYREPPLDFYCTTADGRDATGGLAFTGGGALTVHCNYYWRLIDESWLDVQCPQVYHPDRLGPCDCGYAGDTELHLSGLPFGALKFEIYRTEREIVTVPVRFGLESFAEGVRRRCAALCLAALGKEARYGR